MVARVAKWALGLLVVLLLIGALAAVAAGWYFSGQVIDGMRIMSDPRTLPDVVVTASQDSIELEMDEPPAADPRSRGLTGILTEDADYLQADEVQATRSALASRDSSVALGEVPEPLTAARLESNYFPQDPLVGLGLDFEEIQIRTPLGEAPAWQVSGTSDTWAVFIHGRGAERTEGLRLLRTVHELGLPTLLITYRDDAGAPVEDGLGNFGQTEWPDLEAAVEYALDQGAKDVVLLGASMGGAISVSFLENSQLEDSVVAMVLDAPALSFEQTVDHAAEQRGLPVLGWPIPEPVPWLAKRFTTQRTDIDFDQTDYVSRASDLSVPTLILHGAEDSIVPLSSSLDFAAAAQPGLVTVEVFEEAEHVWSWNVDPQRYDQLVTEHLAAFSSGG